MNNENDGVIAFKEVENGRKSQLVKISLLSCFTGNQTKNIFLKSFTLDIIVFFLSLKS